MAWLFSFGGGDEDYESEVLSGGEGDDSAADEQDAGPVFSGADMQRMTSALLLVRQNHEDQKRKTEGLQRAVNGMEKERELQQEQILALTRQNQDLAWHLAEVKEQRRRLEVEGGTALLRSELEDADARFEAEREKSSMLRRMQALQLTSHGMWRRQLRLSLAFHRWQHVAKHATMESHKSSFVASRRETLAAEEDLRGKLSEASLRCAALQSELNSSRSQNEQLSRALEAAKQEAEAVRRDLASDMERRMLEHSTSIGQSEAEALRLEASLGAAKRREAQVLQRCAALEKEVSGLQRAASAADAAKRAAGVERSNRVRCEEDARRLRAEAERLREQLREAERSRSAAAEEASLLEAERERSEALEGDCEALRQRAEALEESLKGAEERCGAALEDLRRCDAEKASQSQRHTQALDAAERRLREERASREERAARDRSSAAAEAQKLRERVQKMERDASERESRVAELERQSRSLEERLSAERRAAAAREEAEGRWAAERSGLEARLSAARAEIAAEGERKALELKALWSAEAQRLKAAHAAERAEAAKGREELCAELEAELERLRERLRRADAQHLLNLQQQSRDAAASLSSALASQRAESAKAQRVVEEELGASVADAKEREAAAKEALKRAEERKSAAEEALRGAEDALARQSAEAKAARAAEAELRRQLERGQREAEALRGRLQRQGAGEGAAKRAAPKGAAKGLAEIEAGLLEVARLLTEGRDTEDEVVWNGLAPLGESGFSFHESRISMSDNSEDFERVVFAAPSPIPKRGTPLGKGTGARVAALRTQPRT